MGVKGGDGVEETGLEVSWDGDPGEDTGLEVALDGDAGWIEPT